MLQSVRRTQEGRKCAAFDMDYDPIYMNMNSAPGFAHAIYQVLRLERGSSMTLAPVCGSWVWMFAGSTEWWGGWGSKAHTLRPANQSKQTCDYSSARIEVKLLETIYQLDLPGPCRSQL